jgi:hypothetical protein
MCEVGTGRVEQVAAVSINYFEDCVILAYIKVKYFHLLLSCSQCVVRF